MPRRDGRSVVWTCLLAVLAGVAGGCRGTIPTPTPTASATTTANAPGLDVVYAHAAVATDHPVASEAGLAMLRQGGNAVDAAVAASFCLSVVRPYSCGIGGGGFMVIHIPTPDGRGRQVALDYREIAPSSVDELYYTRLADDTASRLGAHAVGVPGTVAGLLTALARYGTLDRAAVLAPAIRAAEEGFVADANYVQAADTVRQRLRDHPRLGPGARHVWQQLCRNGEVAVGDRIANPQHAGALRLVAERGGDAFYRGAIAEAIIGAIENGGGSMTRGDLAAYEVVEVAPMIRPFGRWQVVAMPPPSSGGIAMQQVFGILDRRRIEPATTVHNGPQYVHVVTEALKHAFADRSRWLADPAFVEVPTSRLLDDAYLDGRAASIDPARVGPSPTYGSVLPEDGGTSHISVIDAAGMAVACTETINLVYGSLVEVPGFGFVLNDEMDDFTTIPGAPNAFGLRQSDRNLPAPGKRPLSSMSPTIVLDDGRAILVAGASGGPRIITGTLQCMLNCLWYGMTPAEAVRAPRFHHQWQPDVLQFEPRWTDEATIAALGELGHVTDRGRDVGHVQLVRAGPDGVRAASDPRKGGRPAGY